MGVAAADVVFLGDTAHDRACAKEAGAMFALASWNPKAEPATDDVVLERPEELLELLGLA
jgi:phosphoglycolate phosphatase-like HAD superfamily hydrolase